jgi:hypothetical protein
VHELIPQLETIFGIRVKHLSVNSRPGIDASGHAIGTLYDQVMAPSAHMHMTVTQGDVSRRPIGLHMFDGVTIHAKVISMRSDISIHLLPMHVLEFVVYDFDLFYKDISEYAWNNFSGEFTNQLDNILEEE